MFYNIHMKTVSSIFDTAMSPFSTAKSRAIKSKIAIINGAMQALTSRVTLVESRSVIPLIPALFYGDNLYSIPQDEVDEIIDIRPMKGITTETFFPERQASRVLSGDTSNLRQYLSVEYRDGVQYLNIQQPLSSIASITLSNCDDITNVTATLDASNLALNDIFSKNGSSIDFDLGVTNADGKITFAINSLDLSNITRDGTIQIYIYIPQDLVGKLTNITLTLANDSGFTNTATMTATGNAFGGNFSYGWQPVQFSYRNKTEAGTFDETTITYFSVDLIHSLTTSVTGVKIDSVEAFKGIGYELHYYNQKHFKDSSGNLLKEATKTDDLVIVNDVATEILVQEARKLIDFELRGKSGGLQYNLAKRELEGVYPNPGLYERYRILYPAEKLPEVSNY